MLMEPEADLFASDANVIANPVNCVGVMGKGLALAFKSRYPGLDAFYRQACRAKDLRPGRPVLWRPDNGDQAVLLFPTKRHWRDSSRREDVDDGLAWLARRSGEWDGKVALPALGCGLGGLDFVVLRQMVRYHFAALPMTVELYHPR